jgi:hypothetical protein
LYPATCLKDSSQVLWMSIEYFWKDCWQSITSNKVNEKLVYVQNIPSDIQYPWVWAGCAFGYWCVSAWILCMFCLMYKDQKVPCSLMKSLAYLYSPLFEPYMWWKHEYLTHILRVKSRVRFSGIFRLFL